MMLGDPRAFSIEAYHEPMDSRSPGFGRMALLVSNTTIGDITEKHCGLGDAAERFRQILFSGGPFWDQSFSSLSDGEIFALIDSALYIDSGQSDAELREDEERYGCFDFLTNAGESFDGYKTFIFQDASAQVCILVQNPEDEVTSARCTLRDFRSASHAFVAWYDAQIAPSKNVVQQSVQPNCREDSAPG